MPLRTKVFDTLCVLVEHSGRLLTKHELMQSIWPDTAVEENNLNHNISTLRRALGRAGDRPAVHRDGAARRISVRRRRDELERPARVARPAPAAAPARSLRQEIRFCTATDGIRIAYSTVGHGPPLVKAANWLNHLEFEWESPVWKHWIHAISPHQRSSAMTSADAGCPTGACRISRSTRGCAISKRWSMPSASNVSICSASHRAAPSRSPTPCATRSASAT